MARMNISIPDPLYARLERVRDRVNASKVCAEALEQELDMLEGQAGVADPRIAAMVERLRSKQEKWYSLGYEDGIAWGTEKATREDLRIAKEELEGFPGWALMAARIDYEETDADHEYNLQLPNADLPGLMGADDLDQQVKKHVEPGQRPNKDVDRDAYAEGWRDALIALWETLQRAGRPRRRPQPTKAVDVPAAFKEALGSAE
jgi:hypothetical protein